MKEIRIHHPYKTEQIENTEVVLALGYFDGVHLGHQAVICEAKRLADEKGLKLALMTFSHHPSIVFNKLDFETKKHLASTQKKKERLKSLGVDILYTIDFTSHFAALLPEEFVEKYVIQLHAKVVVAGFDYTYGKKEVANMTTLAKDARGRFEVVSVPEFSKGGEKVSSTRIRSLMDTGEMEKANELLGYPYETKGCVVHGEARGRTLGYPTANIDILEDVRLPKIGVYVTRVKVEDTWYSGMASIGYNDTFDDIHRLTLEVYILNFKEDIYGEEVTVEWLHYIRGMKRFDSVEELVEQLQWDERYTQEFITENKILE